MSTQPAAGPDIPTSPVPEAPKTDRVREAPGPSLITEITVDHGPRDLLGRFFLKADTAARARGITLSFGTFADLVDTNAR
ncbi:MAG TPA: hypothetical protein VJ233_13635, partial [Hyphomicrobiaceae bacterium]|nr:hypothetical protein [Hyphomicrobiaceae bacterium]